MTSPHPLAQWATWREIHAQPAIWRKWAVEFDPASTRAWIDGLGVDEVWFCGAGTSAYIGDILVAGLEGAPGVRFRSVPTTDLVSRPSAYLSGVTPLIVSFGRSGNSTESIGVLDALDALAPDAPRLNITCNPDGALATRHAPGLQQVIGLPEETHDVGFAMTSSFSTMLMTALAVFGPDGAIDQLPSIADDLDALLPVFEAHAQASTIPDRVVFVGAGPLAFAAREAALKVMELTAGQVPALWDSTLGFRHGPKSFVRGDTAIYVFVSGDGHASKYDRDLAEELAAQFPEATVTTIGPDCDIALPTHAADLWAAPLAVAFSQILGVMWSAKLGLNVDDPFTGQGTLSRVVSGVRLYEVSR